MYQKWSTIVQYIGVYCINHIVSQNHTCHTIHRQVGLIFFWLKFEILFESNKLIHLFLTQNYQTT